MADSKPVEETDILDARGVPPTLQAFLFFLSMEPSLQRSMTTEEMAQRYLKLIKHANPLMRLYGLSALQQFKRLICKPKE